MFANDVDRVEKEAKHLRKLEVDFRCKAAALVNMLFNLG